LHGRLVWLQQREFSSEQIEDAAEPPQLLVFQAAHLASNDRLLVRPAPEVPTL